jgi:asparagine synthase (glutamine-hydrolysing)
VCGLTGSYARPGRRIDPELLLAMAGELRHRGPDGTGLYLDGRFGMANTRLAIVDLEGGDQPLSCEDGRFWAMQNGEIYNHVELRRGLTALGHRFATRSDTEVIAHAFEEWGVGCLERFNGDFAIAVWDRHTEELLLARDRFGIRPLFVAEWDEDFCFASECKALLRHPAAVREVDPVGIVDTFTVWSTQPDRSALAGIRELPPAHYQLIGPDGAQPPKRWWEIEFAPEPAPTEQLVGELDELLSDATRIRLRADVPVATYLSGGLDSSVMAAIASSQVPAGSLHAFGVGFEDEHFNESAEQEAIGRELGVDLQRTRVSAESIAEDLPAVVSLAEKPLLRTAPAPLLRLSGAVRSAGLKVVLTGEGADEMFAGYDIFREDLVRRFWARNPDSVKRPLLLRRINRFLANDPSRAAAFLNKFYARDLLAVDDPLYSHRLRMANTSRCLGLLNPELVKAAEESLDPAARLLERLPAEFHSWTPLARAQYLEMTTFLEGYLLHAQGDRMLMGNSIEGRFPFLDFRVAEFAARLPDAMRLRGLQEKFLLRRAAARRLPPSIHQRPKVPYRAPIRDVFFGERQPEYVREVLSTERVLATGLLDPQATKRVVARFERGGAVGETQEMALVGLITLMLLHDQFVADPALAPPAIPTRVVVGDSVVTGWQGEAVFEAR